MFKVDIAFKELGFEVLVSKEPLLPSFFFPFLSSPPKPPSLYSRLAHVAPKPPYFEILE